MANVQFGRSMRLPVLALLHPRQHSRAMLAVAALGVLGGTIATAWFNVPLWRTSLAVLLLLLVPAIPKWADDRRRYGTTAMAISMLLAAQGFHTVEHVSQVVQYHLLGWPLFRSSGLISTLNAEWVHFVWNWAVVAAALFLLRGGVRNRWSWLLLIWATAHTLEHTYLMVRYLQMQAELAQIGFPALSAQGLPGVLGRDGWLATSPFTRGSFICRAPGIATAPRLDIHFWWNAGEMVLLLLAAHVFLAKERETGNEDRG